jgi:UPF0716 protein FxsA
MPLKWIIVAIVALPLAELVVYLAVASQIGFLRAFLLQLVCSAVGLLVLRRTGEVRLARWKAGRNGGPIGGFGSGDGGAVVAGGILLFIPGFITDAVGLVLLVPPLRYGVGSLIRRILTRHRRTRRPDDAVIDLEPDEWHEVSPRKRARRTARKSTPKSSPNRDA